MLDFLVLLELLVLLFSLSLGTGDATKTDDFLETFQRGAGVIFNPKIYAADFGTLNRAFSA